MKKNANDSRPLYLRLRERLEKEIHSGRLAVSQPLPSEREMCERYRVSQITVRAALRELQGRGLVVRIPGKGTFVAAPLKKWNDERKAVGFISNNLSEYSERPFMLELLAGIKTVMHQADVNFMLFLESESNYRELAREGRLHGAIIPNPQIGMDILQDLQNAHTSLVVVGHPNSRRIDSVDSDNRLVGYTMARHLLENGYRRVGFIGYDVAESYCADRLAGYKQALREAGIQVKHAWQCFAPGHDCGRREVLQLCEAGADAALCVDDMIAGNVLASLRSAGIGVPGEFGVTGCNNTILTRFLSPTLTSMELFPELLGKAAAEKLLTLMSGGTPERRTVFSGELQVRDSSVRLGGHPAAAAETVANGACAAG